MTDRLLYNLTVPESAQLTQRAQQVRQLLAEGTLSPGAPAVESISSDAGTKTLTARFADPLAEKLANEFEELFSNDAIEAVPYFVRGEQTDPRQDRYVALNDVDLTPGHPTDPRVQEIDGQLTTVGSRRTHWRALRTAPTTESNPFGSDSTAEVGIPNRARKVRWFDPTGGTLSDASLVRTEAGEHDEIAIYDAASPSITDPVLIYDVPYRHEWPVDVRVWDDRNGDKLTAETDSDATVGSSTLGSGTVGDTTTALRWQRVFSPAHPYEGTPLVENDLLRLEFDAPHTLRAYRWDASEEHYAQVQLGNTDWRLDDVNIRRIGVERVDGQAEFQDSNGNDHFLNFSLKRGYTDVLWLNPDNEGSVPADLVTRLDPIAATSDEDPAAVADVVERNEVDR